MSSSEFQAEEPPDVVETELDSWGAWVQTLASTTDAPRVSSVGAAVSPYVPKYPGLQEFSRRYADVHGYIAAVVCILGVLANLVNIVVLTRRKMITPTNVILTWLAVADLLTMAVFLPFCLHFYVLRDRRLQFPSTQSVGWIRFLIFNINNAVLCHTIAIWLTIALAIFRYICVCYPTRGAQLCSLKRAKLAIFAIYVTSAVVCIPNYMVTMVVKKNFFEPVSDAGNLTTTPSWLAETSTSFALSDPQHHSPQSFSYYTVKDRDSWFLLQFNYWIQAFFFKLVPCVLLTALTVMLIIAMHQANVRRMKLKSQGRQDESERAREHNRTTAMLLAVVGLFQLTELPQGVLTLCSIFIPNFFFDVYWPLGDVLDIAALLNNAINFVLYCTMSRQFRETFVEIFLKRFSGVGSSDVIGHVTAVGRTRSVQLSISGQL